MGGGAFRAEKVQGAFWKATVRNSWNRLFCLSSITDFNNFQPSGETSILGGT